MDTKKAAKILQTFFEQHRRLPSYQEMCQLFGFKSKKASFDLAQKLVALGILEKEAQGKLRLKHTQFELPILGSIQAGFPTPAEEQLYMTMSFDQYLVDKPQESFVLKVTGDSMTLAGINDGDLVIIEKNQHPREGDIVVAFIDGAWTLKYFQRKNGQVCLVPANPKYPVLFPSQTLEIWGTVRSVIRKYN